MGDVFLKMMPKRGVVRFWQVGQAIAKVYWALRGAREGRYSCIPVVFTAKLIECSCGIPCLHTPEVHSKFNSCGGLRRALC